MTSHQTTQASAARLSALFVNYNSWRLCVTAIQTLHDDVRRVVDPRVDLEVVVVDNASPQRDAQAEQQLEQLLAEIGGKLIRHDENGGYGKGMNLALAHAHGDLLLVSNPDVEFQPGCVQALLTRIDSDPSIGAVAPEGFWDPDLEMKLPPNILPTLGDLLRLSRAARSSSGLLAYMRRRTRQALPVWDAHADVDLAMLSGCCFLLRRATVQQIGFFDERFPLYYEDTDLSMRIRKAGLRMVQVYGARIIHLYNQSGQTDSGLAMQRYWISRRLYYQKWYGRFGTWLYDRCGRYGSTPRAQRLAKLRRHENLIDLGEFCDERPRIDLPRDVGRFLVEMCLDENFYLATCTFGSGSSWSPGDRLFDHFWSATYFFRVLDISGGRQPEELGIWKYTLRKQADGTNAGTAVVARSGHD